MMRILFIGDVYGQPGRKALSRWLPDFRLREGVDFVIANVENSAGGKGVSLSTFDEIARAGVDAMTGGNHSFAQRESYGMFDHEPRLLRPANLPPGTPGHGLGVYDAPNGARVAVLNLMGRVFMKPIDCPFRTANALAAEARAETPILIVDFHAEATSEKVAMAAYLDGAATAVIGTHTHIPTADARVSKRGTAAITDAGMTGPYASVIGVRTEIVLENFLIGMPNRNETGSEDVRICGLLIDLDERTGRAVRAKAVREPEFIAER